ncbi:protein-tyrosine phosphatase-like protein [Xylariales sp. AK1849]|nr:protein-tyrosine phosphatase-like protein [Xylariales sp. AK1849]
MGWLDRIPRAGNLYIGGLGALNQTDLIQRAGITHVLSIIDYDIEAKERLQGMNHLHISAEDRPGENIIQHFESANTFIEDGLRDDGGVFVHCAMGKSRSATAVCAYLMWKYGVSPNDALMQVCEGRPVCEPNAGFMEQLEVYYQVLKAKTKVEKVKAMKHWDETRYRGESWEWDAWKQGHARWKL